MSRQKEITKFACGAEAFHAAIHAYLWASRITIAAFGIKESPTWHRNAAIGNAVVALALGIFAWGTPSDHSLADSSEPTARRALPIEFMTWKKHEANQ